ncbi:poly(3-hydroxyalkanoate) depolymerase [Cumulibacter manganitolerans]|uniref:poly(3-hydroxyalkanoate) depolymerase n=1 Tax=Cumulibacter manganitolerans TaxID=1884992 RepID=UPI001294C7CF|nr:poly(3-hydroxyalkanoate) depolymerase [Cumulibacter manganitolerans]
MTESTQNLQVGDRSIRVAVREGSADRPPLVLCNGIGARLALLQPFVDALDSEIGVIRFDVPGVGRSSAPGMPYTFASVARLLGEVLDELGVDQVDVLGFSWGGGLAQQFALQNPRRCRRLVLVSTTTGSLMVPASPPALLEMAAALRDREPGYASRIAATLYGGRLRDEPRLARRYVFGHFPRANDAGYLMQVLAAACWTSLPALPLIRQKTLILAGDDDPIIPVVNARIMHALLPNAELDVFADGHLGLITGARELAPRVAEFLDD